MEYRNQRRTGNNSQYEEYRAFVREQIFRRSKKRGVQTRPSLEERRQIWEEVKRDYFNLPQGKYPVLS